MIHCFYPLFVLKEYFFNSKLTCVSFFSRGKQLPDPDIHAHYWIYFFSLLSPTFLHEQQPKREKERENIDSHQPSHTARCPNRFKRWSPLTSHPTNHDITATCRSAQPFGNSMITIAIVSCCFFLSWWEPHLALLLTNPTCPHYLSLSTLPFALLFPRHLCLFGCEPKNPFAGLLTCMLSLLLLGLEPIWSCTVKLSKKKKCLGFFGWWANNMNSSKFNLNERLTSPDFDDLSEVL